MRDKSKPIALFLPSLADGGAERAFINLATALAEDGDLVHLVVGAADDSAKALIPASIRVIDLDAPRVLHAVPALASYLRSERPRALISAMDHANMAAIVARATSATKTPVIVTLHVNPHMLARHATRVFDRIVPILIRHVYPHAEGIVCVSDGIAQAVAGLARRPLAQLTVIPNAVVGPNLTAQAAESLDHPWFAAGGPPVIVAAGRLTEQKRFDLLLQAFARLRSRQEIRLAILGEGPLATTLEATAATLGVANDVHFAGFQRNPYRYMSRASIFVLSSDYEGFGLVLVEAMALGTPVVSTDCPSGPAEILQQGRFGRLVPPGDPVALASAIAQTLEEQPNREALMARAGEFSFKAVSARYRALLEQIERKRA